LELSEPGGVAAGNVVVRSQSPVAGGALLMQRSAVNHGLTDLSVPAEEFARLELPVSQIFITENRMGERVRLEQERIGHGFVERAVQSTRS
jgi:hypothetical protein